MSRGLWITFEGGDGSGKTTQAELLRAALEGAGHSVVRTREPGGTEVGQRIRDIVLHSRGSLTPRAEALLFAADRSHHVETLVEPALARGETVIQDRYLDSSVAYQGAARSLGADEVRELSLWATGGALPDVTVLLDIDPRIARARLDAADKPFDRMEAEKAEFHARVRDAFLALAAAEPGRFLVVDATLPVDEIAGEILARVSSVGGRL
ncbi:dTMP kinase [Microbacterium indicum]|uniref:dTMP kinase n=1 Tax=Microbacterium indicum TaxID=358100 RepID=UPI0004067353|nr:dTMP kinase [Microbacterium indicum]